MCECEFPVDLELHVGFNCSQDQTAGVQRPHVTSSKSANAHSSADACVFFEQIGAAARGVPLIYNSHGGRTETSVAIDRRLRECDDVNSYVKVLTQVVTKMDPGNAVVALAQAAKVAEGRVATLESHPVWETLLAHIERWMQKLEPRGLSMAAYACAKLGCTREILLYELGRAGCRRAKQFSAVDMAKMCWAFAKLGVVDDSLDFWNAMVLEIPVKVHEGSITDVSMLAWSFATAGIGDEAMFREIAKANLAMLGELPPQSLSNILWAHAKMSLFDPELVTAVCSRALSVIEGFVEFDVCNMCWALAQMDAVDYVLFDQLANHAVRTGMWKRFSAMMLSEVAWAFAYARFCHADFFQALSECVLRHVAVFDNQHVAMLAWVFAAVGADVPKACATIGDYAKGGKLWSFQHDAMCALLWAFAKIEWADDALFCDIVHVAKLRTDEYDADSSANLLSALTTLRLQRRDGLTCVDMEIDETIDFIVDALMSRTLTLADADTFYMVVSSLCSLGRAWDARRLFDCLSRFEITSPLRCYSVLLLEAEQRQEPIAGAQLWLRLAAGTKQPLLCVVYLEFAAATYAYADRSVLAKASLQLTEELQVSTAASQLLLKRFDSVDPPAAVNEAVACFLESGVDSGSCFVKFSPDWADGKEAPSPEIRLLQEVLVRYNNVVSDTGKSAASDVVLQSIEVLGAELEAGGALLPGLLPPASAAALCSWLDKLISSQSAPRVVVELGAGIGHATMILATRLCRLGDVAVVAVEEDPTLAAVARSLFELAGIAQHVHLIVGPVHSCLPALLQRTAGRGAEMLLLRGGSPRCSQTGKSSCAARCVLKDLLKAEAAGCLVAGCTIVTDVRAGHIAPGGRLPLRLLWHVGWRQHRYSAIEMCAERQSGAGSSNFEDWIAITRLLAAQSDEENGSAHPFPSELVALAAESDSLWRQRANTVAFVSGEGVDARRWRTIGATTFVSSAEHRFSRRARLALERLHLVAPATG